MSDRFRRMALVVLLGVGALTPAERAMADEPTATPPDLAAEARRQYNVGKAAYDTGRYAEAALAWEAAAAIKPHAATLFSAALAWERAGHPERAADDFGRATTLPGLTPEQTTAAINGIAVLERTLGTLDVSGPEGWRVQVDALTEVTVPARLHAVPGPHALLVRVPGQPVDHHDVVLEAGKTSPFVLTAAQTADVAPPAPAPYVEPAPSQRPARAPAPAHASAPPARRYAGFGVLGMGVATLGAAIVLGVEALGARDAYDAGPSQAAYDHAHAMQSYTNAAFVLGGVLTGGGLALVFWPSPKAKATAALRLTPWVGGAGLGGAF